jgi:hypothetical protein
MASRHETIQTATAVIWLLGYAAIVIAKHTIFSDTWGSRDLSLHWHYWAWQAAWTLGVIGIGAIVADYFRCP